MGWPLGTVRHVVFSNAYGKGKVHTRTGHKGPEGVRWVWVVNATPRPLYPRESGNDLIQEFGWAPGTVWTVTENLAPPTGIRSQYRPVSSVSLNRLIYPGRPIIRTLGQIILNDNIKKHRIPRKLFEEQEKKNAKISVG